MRGRGHLAAVLGTALVLSIGCGPTVVGEVDDEEVAAAGLVYVTTRDAAVPLVEELLGPVLEDETPRLVESAGGNSILLVEEEELVNLAGFFHDNFHRCGGFATHTSLAEARHAITADPGDTAGPPDEETLLAGEAAAINRMLPVLDRTRILATIMGLSSFPTRYYTSSSGVSAANWLRDRWNELAAGKSHVSVSLYPHAGWAQPSVMMTILGTDLPDEFVVVGGHLDSITFGGGNAPGADDDASGVATFTEMARVLLADGVRFRRTVVFIAYAAEEVGLRGSNEIADQWAAESRNVRGVMQLDMTAFKGTPTADIVLFEDYTSPTMTNALEVLANTYLPTLVISRDSCGYACSDHAPWFQNGFPTVLPFESQMDDYNPNIHSGGDTMAFFGNNADHAIKFARLGLAWVVQQARVAGAAPTGVIRLAQVAYDIPGLDGPGEFVELYNTGTTAMSVAGWQLVTPTISRTLPAGASVPAGGYLTIARDLVGFANLYGSTADLQRCPALPNGASTLTLRNAAGTAVDEVRWESTGWSITAPTGSSLYRTNPGGTDSNTVSDWSVAPTDPH
jgi:bacterial leucyl aminopeptidase